MEFHVACSNNENRQYETNRQNTKLKTNKSVTIKKIDIFIYQLHVKLINNMKLKNSIKKHS